MVPSPTASEVVSPFQIVPSPTVSEVTIPFQIIPSPAVSEVIPFQIIMAYGSRSDPAKMVFPIKIFSTSVVEVKIVKVLLPFMLRQ